MVGHMPLEHGILVRAQASQPNSDKGDSERSRVMYSAVTGKNKKYKSRMLNGVGPRVQPKVR